MPESKNRTGLQLALAVFAVPPHPTLRGTPGQPPGIHQESISPTFQPMVPQEAAVEPGQLVRQVPIELRLVPEE